MNTNEVVTSTEVAIVGGGPIGIELAIALERLNVPYILFEAKQIGDAFSMWPPNTHFFSTPEHVALAGVPVHNLDQQSITGEQYLAYLRMLVEMFDLNLRAYEPVTAVSPQDDGTFILKTNHRTGERQYRAQHVVMASGGMDGPRLLNIPGEDLPHVSHYFKGPHPYFRQRILIVGGRNSAVEAALRCWRVGAKVAISYRNPEFEWERIKPHLGMDMGDRLQKGEITMLPSTLPVEITPSVVKLAHTDDGITPTDAITAYEADFVLLATGFVADMSVLRDAGVDLAPETEAPAVNEETMETNVPGLYVAGTVAGGTQSKFVHFISTTHDHVAKIVIAITGKQPGALGTIAARNNAVTWEEVKAN